MGEDEGKVLQGDQYGGVTLSRPSLAHTTVRSSKQRNDESSDQRRKEKKPSFLFRHPPSALTALNGSGERAKSTTLYAGGRSNRSPSPEAETDLDESLTLALLALKAADSCEEMLVVRMLRDRPTPRSAGARAGGKVMT
jgi:hypothetical protein